MLTFTKSYILSATVDRLAIVKADIARLKAEEDNLKDALIESGESTIEGTLHRVAVSQCEGREVIDWKAVAAKFNPSHQLVTAYTTHGEPYAVVRISSRKG